MSGANDRGSEGGRTKGVREGEEGWGKGEREEVKEGGEGRSEQRMEGGREGWKGIYSNVDQSCKLSLCG